MRATPIFAAALLAAGCKGAQPTDALTFATFNAGLAVAFVPAANERAPAVADAVAALDADVVCLQEVWLPEHVSLVADAAAAAFPEQYFPDAQQLEFTEPACPAGELDEMVACMADHCDSACADEVVDCLFTNCALPFLGLPKDCNRCVQAHVGLATADEVAVACNGGGIEYAYGGSFGTGILSKYPMSVEETVFDSTTNRRGLLHATIEAPDQTIDAWCTHLTAGLSVIPYPREEGTWESEQKAQVDLLAGLVADAPDPVIVMGDLNNGPATADAEAEFPDHFDALLAAGLEAPYVQKDGRCTFCPDNALSSVDSDATGRLIDHLLVRGFEGEATPGRVIDGAMDVESCGATIPGAVSDHYGASLSIAAPE